jgi:ABC-type phosphate/phosphonate transport system substrate-binding protein
MRLCGRRLTCLLVLLAAAAGCQTARSLLLSVIGVEKKPLAVALVMDVKPEAALAVLNPFPRYAALQQALAQELGRPVAVDPCFAFQAQRELETGWYHVAVVTPVQYARLPEPLTANVLVVPVDAQGRTARAAVLVVRADSSVRAAADLRGQSVAFGPEDDSRTHHAALQLLREAGLARTDLALEVLPVPGSLKHLPTAQSVLQAVIRGSAAAGFVDEAAWEELPDTGGPDEPARDMLRIVGRTAALPDRLFVASPQLDEATADAVREALLRVGTQRPDALSPLGISGYAVPDAELLRACRALSGSQPPVQDAAESRPVEH